MRRIFPLSLLAVLTLCGILPAQAAPSLRSYLPGTLSSTAKPYSSSLNAPVFSSASPAPIPVPTASPAPAATPAPTVTTAASGKCVSDGKLATAVRQQAASVGSDLQGRLPWNGFSYFADQAKRGIDHSALGTGGRTRDIFISDASSDDKQDQVEEFFRKELAPLPAQLATQAEQRADSLVQAAQTSLVTAYSPLDNAKGSASANRSFRSFHTAITRSGSFALKERTNFFFFDTVGRFSYTVRAETTVSMNRLHVSEQYTSCAGNQKSGEYAADTSATVAPILQITYRFVPASGESYDGFSGSFYLVGNDEKAVRDLDISRPLF